jgi:hypothetical protein
LNLAQNFEFSSHLRDQRIPRTQKKPSSSYSISQASRLTPKPANAIIPAVRARAEIMRINTGGAATAIAMINPAMAARNMAPIVNCNWVRRCRWVTRLCMGGGGVKIGGEKKEGVS